MNILIWLLVFQSCCVFAIESSAIKTNKSEIVRPRIFWNALGNFISSIEWLPIEINVPETLSSMVQGVSSMWQSVSSFFSSSSQASQEEPQIDYDLVEQQLPVMGGIEVGGPSVDYEIIDPTYVTPKKKKKQKAKKKKFETFQFDIIDLLTLLIK